MSTASGQLKLNSIWSTCRFSEKKETAKCESTNNESREVTPKSVYWTIHVNIVLHPGLLSSAVDTPALFSRWWTGQKRWNWFECAVCLKILRACTEKSIFFSTLTHIQHVINVFTSSSTVCTCLQNSLVCTFFICCYQKKKRKKGHKITSASSLVYF